MNWGISSPSGDFVMTSIIGVKIAVDALVSGQFSMPTCTKTGLSIGSLLISCIEMVGMFLAIQLCLRVEYCQISCLPESET